MLKALKNRLNNRKGFTLIELIVVIAIIAILAAVLVPRMIGFTDNARRRAVESDARNILTAASAIVAEGNTVSPTTLAPMTGNMRGTLSYTGTGSTITFTYTLDSWRVTVTDGVMASAVAVPVP